MEEEGEGGMEEAGDGEMREEGDGEMEEDGDWETDPAALGGGAADGVEGFDGAGRPMHKQRFVWTSELHRRFEAAVNTLGIDHAKPQTISDLMDFEGAPTRLNIKSHLQKYRLLRQKRARQGGGSGGDSATSSAAGDGPGADKAGPSSGGGSAGASISQFHVEAIDDDDPPRHPSGKDKRSRVGLTTNALRKRTDNLAPCDLAPSLCVTGRRCYAHYGQGEDELWFRGTITQVYYHNLQSGVPMSADVRYDDEEEEEQKPLSRIVARQWMDSSEMERG